MLPGMEARARTGEDALVARLVGRLRATDGVLVGPGDDAALLSGGPEVLATADLLVEGSHFDLAFSSPADVGWKALAVNVSDIAAMGGTPRYALVSLGLPEDGEDVADALYRGLAEAAAAFGVGVAGGDVVRSDVLLVGVAALGDPPPGGPVLRSGARPGDVACVTGTLGGAAAGLALLRAATTDPEALALLDRCPSLVEAHRRGRARVAEGRAAAAAGAHAMIDVSDGLALDLSRVCEASGVGVEVRAADLPLAPGVADVAAWLGEDPARIGLGGGDDYELAIAIPAEGVAALAGIVTVVGRFTEGRASTIDGAPLPPLGWDPFRG